jgi:signal transduction histidine kinase
VSTPDFVAADRSHEGGHPHGRVIVFYPRIPGVEVLGPGSVRPRVVMTTSVGIACVVLATSTSTADWSEVALALTLPLAFAVAGLVGLHRRPGTPTAAFVAAVGLSHLWAFALVAASVHAGREQLPTVEASAAAVGAVMYLLGFVALVAVALTLAAERPLSRSARRVLLGLCALALLPPALTAVAAHRQRLVLVLDGWPEYAAGAGLLPALGDISAGSAVLLAAPVAAAAIVVWRYIRSAGATRRRLRWPAAAFAAVFAAIVVQQLVGRDLPSEAAALIVVAALAVTPFALLPSVLAGSVDDERLAAVVRGAVVLAAAWTVAAVCYAAIAAATGLSGPARTPAATAVLVVCGLAPLVPQVRRAVAGVAERLVTGPTADGYDLLREYGLALATTDGLTGLCEQTAHALRRALGAPWAEMTLLSGEHGRAGPGVASDHVVALRVVIADDDAVLGELCCGRRRRGPYAPREIEAVQALARQTALAVRNRRLAEDVIRHVEELAASRHRLALAGDEERRRIERDLHDGTQQDLIALLSRVELARTVLGVSVDEAARTLDELRADVARAITSLRRTVQGIHPPVLTDQGLVAAVMTRVSELPMAVDIHVCDDLRARRFPLQVEASAYYVIVESLTNVLKYSGVRTAAVHLRLDGDTLLVSVSDAGRGGAAPAAGTGLAGLADRLAAVDGDLEVISVPGQGTQVQARLPARADVTAVC